MSVTAGSIRVLHVDDEPDLATTAAAFLERTDGRIAVETAASAEEGLDRLERSHFDCVVSDYDMPGLNGIEFLERVRESFPDLPFVLFTGKGSEEVASDAISAGVTDYLQKDVGSDQYALLANRVVNAAERYAAQREVDWHQTVLRNMGEGVYVFDADYVFHFVDFRSVEDEATHEEDWTGRSLSYFAEQEILTPEEVKWIEEATDRIVAEDVKEVRLEVEPAVPESTEVVELRLRPLDVDAGRDMVLGTSRDVTDRKRYERELQRYETLIEEATDLITVLDADGTIRYQSPSVERVLGYEQAELVGETAIEYVHPEDRAQVTERFAELTSDGTQNFDRFQYRIRHADGSWRWLESQADSQMEATLDGYIVTSRDVTERKERLREHEQYAAIVNSMADAAFVVDSDWRLERANESALSHGNETMSDVAGAPIMDLTRQMAATEADARRFESALEAAFEDDADATTVELELDLPDGEITAEYRLSSVQIDGERRIVVTGRDITARKRREETLGTLHEVTRGFMDAADQQSVADHTVETASRVLEHPITGVWLYDESADALEPAAVTETGRDIFEDPPNFDRGEGLAWDVFESGEAAVFDDVHEEPERYNPDTPIESEILLPLGEYGVMAIGRIEQQAFDDVDVTLARILANTVEGALARADRESQLRTKHRELQRQNERLDEFASIISHDLRNPLQVLQGAIELAEETGNRDHFDRCRRSVERMERLISDLLTLAREGESNVDPRPVELADLIESAWGNVDTGTATVVVDTDRRVVADRSRLKQLLENLFRNSIEHGSPAERQGDGDSVRITVGELRDGAGFYVEDDGPGIPPDDRDRIFESGHSTTSEGIGLGLAIVERIADAHGWEVRVSDGADGGARFEFRGADLARPA